MDPKSVLISTNDRRIIDDTRMSVERPFVRDWNLHIRNVKTSDAGTYTCQINTDPIQIKRIRLTVHGVYTVTCWVVTWTLRSYLTAINFPKHLVIFWQIHVVVRIKINENESCWCVFNKLACCFSFDFAYIVKKLFFYPVPAVINNDTSSGNLTVREGERVELTCQASGVPEPSITWYRRTALTNNHRERMCSSASYIS